MTESKNDVESLTSGRPAGSRIDLRVDEGRLCLATPPRGIHLAAILQIFGGMLCLAITRQWTQRTLAAEDVGAAWVSLPFWLLGVGVILAAVHAMLVHHRLEITPEKGWIRSLPLGWKRSLITSRLAVRFDHVTRGEADGRGGVEVPVLVIEEGSHAFRLLEGFNDAERRWVRGELIGWLATHARR